MDLSKELQNLDEKITANGRQGITGPLMNDAVKQIANALNSGKVDAVEGKGLSTNDYDNAEKQKVADAQPKNAEGLQTTSKDIVGAINEVKQTADNAQPKEDGKGLSTNDYTTEDKNKVTNALLKTKQTLNQQEQAQVQTNIGVKNTVDVVGVGEITDVPQEIAEDRKYRDTDGAIQSNQYYFISNPYAVKRGDIIVGSVTALKDIAVISRVSDTNEFLYTIYSPSAEGSSHNVHIVIQFDGYVSFSAVKDSMRLKHIPCKLASLIGEPAGGYNRKLYEAAGAVYNETSGFYELNGLTDITESEMADIYAAGYVNEQITASTQSGIALYCTFYQNKKVLYRTLLCSRKQLQMTAYTGGTLRRMNLDMTFLGQENMEILVLSTEVAKENQIRTAPIVTFAAYTFSYCTKLTKIDGILNMKEATSVANMFKSCNSLQIVYLHSLKQNISFSDSPNLTVEDTTDSSLGYMVENAANGDTPITITLHADAFARVPETLKQKATAKNISIVSA